MTAPDLDELLTRMSWAEKLAQLQILWRRDDDDALTLARHGIGALFWPQSAERTNALQRAAVEESAHGIPLLIGLDVVHGQFTIFPHPAGAGGELRPAVAEAAARVGHRGPLRRRELDLLADGRRDPRSPLGSGRRGVRRGRVLSPPRSAPPRCAHTRAPTSPRPMTLAACLKHFVAYGAAEAGRDYNTTDVSPPAARHAISSRSAPASPRRGHR